MLLLAFFLFTGKGVTHAAAHTSEVVAHSYNAADLCPSYDVPGEPNAVAIVNNQNPSLVVYLEAIPAGVNLVYYVWSSSNGINGNPVQEGARAPGTLVYDIYLMGYPTASVCDDWTVAGYMQMY
jgi:hypothetical protein